MMYMLTLQDGGRRFLTATSVAHVTAKADLEYGRDGWLVIHREEPVVVNPDARGFSLPHERQKVFVINTDTGEHMATINDPFYGVDDDAHTEAIWNMLWMVFGTNIALAEAILTTQRGAG